MINPPTPLIINTPQIWYTIIYLEYLLLGGWGGLLLWGGDYKGSPAVNEGSVWSKNMSKESEQQQVWQAIKLAWSAVESLPVRNCKPV